MRQLGRALILLLVLCGFVSPPAVAADGRRPVYAKQFDASLRWLNVKRPLSLQDLKGKVVILDFWTYGCVNCIHVLEDLRRLEAKFGDKLAVIGVHTPKFDNEKNLDTLRSIVIRYRIEHPVVNDVDFSLATYYRMRAWPTQVVIDPQGKVAGQVVGEKNYEVLEQGIETLIERQGKKINTDPLPIRLERDGAQDSLLAAPGKIAVSGGRVAISDTLHNRVIFADDKGRVESIYGGTEVGFRDGRAASARFSSPQGLAFSGDGLYVADSGNHAIRHIDPATGRVETVAGGGEDEIGVDGDFEATAVRLRSPWGLALKDGRLYIAMAGTHQIWTLDIRAGRIRHYAGSGLEGLRDGTLAESRFSQPSGLSLHGNRLYVADAEDSAIRRIDIEAGRVETLVGTGLFDFGDRDGAFEDALLQHVLGVAVLSETSLLVTDTYNHKLKRLDLKKRQVETLAGTGRPGRESGIPQALRLNEPGGLAVSGNRVLIADTNNNRIVRYDLDSGYTGEWILTQ